MKEALIAFVRGAVQAGVAAAALFLTGNLDATNFNELVAGVALAFIGGVIAFAGAYLRESTTPAATKRATALKQPSKFDWLPF